MRRRIEALVAWGRSLFPVRVWLHFLEQNGLLLAAGVSYQALFAVFAGIYVGFSIAGIVLLGRAGALDSLIDIVGTAIPGLIGPDGVFTAQQLTELVGQPTGFLTATGIVALGGLIWTAVGWMTFSRMAVRQVLGLDKDQRNYFFLKARDFLVALGLGLLLLVSAALSVASTAALEWIFRLAGWSTASVWYSVLARGSGLLIVFVINTLVLAVLFRFLSRAAIQWRRLWGGSLLGGAAMLGIQVASSALVGGAVRNPLLATFAVFVGLLLFFRLMSIATLAAAAWIAVGARDRQEPLRRLTEEQQRALRERAEWREHLAAARERVREAQRAYDESGWLGRVPAASRLRAAERELAEVSVADPARDD